MAVMGLQTKANFYILVLSHRVTCTSSCHVNVTSPLTGWKMLVLGCNDLKAKVMRQYGNIVYNCPYGNTINMRKYLSDNHGKQQLIMLYS